MEKKIALAVSSTALCLLLFTQAVLDMQNLPNVSLQAGNLAKSNPNQKGLREMVKNAISEFRDPYGCSLQAINKKLGHAIPRDSLVEALGSLVESEKIVNINGKYKLVEHGRDARIGDPHVQSRDEHRRPARSDDPHVHTGIGDLPYHVQRSSREEVTSNASKMR